MASLTARSRSTTQPAPAATARRAARPRRRTELGLLLLAWIAIVFAYVLVTLSRTAHVSAGVLPFLVGVLALLLVAHLANRRFAPDADPTLLPIVGLLNGLGWVMIARLGPGVGAPGLARLQAAWSAVGVLAYVATLVLFRRPVDIERYRYLIAFAGVAMLLLPLAPVIGESINGARLWARFGPITFQPVELAKIGLAIFFASYFVEKRELLSTPTLRVGDHLLPDPRPFGPVLLAWGTSILIMVAERDVGFSLLLFLLFIGMLWIATNRALYLVVGAVLFAFGAFVAAHLFAQVNVRMSVWLDPWPHASTTGYQVIQALYALGSGGVAGTGLGLGHPSLVPVVVSDFIFAAFGEELGLLGTTTIVMAFLLLVGAGIRIALSARTEFSKLLAAGLTGVLGLQAFFIMAGVVRLLPLTGVTLPFVAYGGSSLLSNYVLVGLLMRISDSSRAPSPLLQAG